MSWDTKEHDLLRKCPVDLNNLIPGVYKVVLEVDDGLGPGGGRSSYLSYFVLVDDNAGVVLDKHMEPVSLIVDPNRTIPATNAKETLKEYIEYSPRPDRARYMYDIATLKSKCPNLLSTILSEWGARANPLRGKL